MEQAPGPGGGVTWVGKVGFAGCFALSVQLFKSLARHQDFTAHLKTWGVLDGIELPRVDPERHRSNRLYIGSYILPLHAVAACDAAREHAIFVSQRHRQAVQF